MRPEPVSIFYTGITFLDITIYTPDITPLEIVVIFLKKILKFKSVVSYIGDVHKYLIFQPFDLILKTRVKRQ